MSDDGFAELAKLKQRLESLGVKIRSCPEKSSPSQAEEVTKCDEDDVGRLLARCNKVEAALNAQPDGDSVDNVRHGSPPPRSPDVGAELIVHPNRANARQSTKKADKPAFVATVRQSQQLTARARGSPLSNLLADYRDAEARWNQEKASLRRTVAAEKKRANKLESSFNKLSGMYEARLVDLKALRTALKKRDEQVQAAVQHSRDLEEAHMKANENVAEDMAALARERDDLKALLVATLKRLETVDRVVRRADMSNAVMEERVTLLEEEKNKAVEAADSAQARVDSLLKSQRRIEWQNKMLDRISEVQLAHNRSKTAAMQQLLHSGKGKTECASSVGETYTEDM